MPNWRATGGSGPGTVGQISCPATGYCTYVGNYVDTAGDVDLGIASEVEGTWTSEEVVLPASVTGSPADLGEVSCPTVGSCTAAGSYQTGTTGGVFVETER